MTTWGLCAVFLLSGAAGLLFETLWFRQAGLAFGNGIWASSLVLSSFMAGLALGNGLAARFGNRILQPVRLYALLEAVIAATGVALVFLLPELAGGLAPLWRPFLDQPWILNPLRLVVGFTLLLIPATAMGATLPLLVKALRARDTNFGAVLGRLYGWNTAGAVLGAVAGEAALIAWFGVRGTTWVAAGLNLAAAAGALALAARVGHTATPRAAPRAPVAGLRRALPLLAAALLAGSILLALEVVWFRLLSLFVYSAGLSFALMLAIVLAGIALGGFAGGLWLRRRPQAFQHVPGIALLAGCAAVGSYIAFGMLIDPSGAPAVERSHLRPGSPRGRLRPTNGGISLLRSVGQGGRRCDRTAGPGREALRLHREAPVETRPKVLPRHASGEFDELFPVERFEQPFDLRIRHGSGRSTEGLGIVENPPLQFAEERTLAMGRYCQDHGVFESVVSAHGRADVQSEDTACHGRCLQRGQVLEARIDGSRAFENRFEESCCPHHGTAVGHQTQRLDDRTDSAPGFPKNAALNQPRLGVVHTFDPRHRDLLCAGSTSGSASLPPQQEECQRQGHQGRNINADEIQSPVGGPERPACRVVDVQQCVGNEERRRDADQRQAITGRERRPDESAPDGQEGAPDVPNEVGVERTRVGHRSRQIQVPAQRRHEHPDRIDECSRTQQQAHPAHRPEPRVRRRDPTVRGSKTGVRHGYGL